ncbi:NADH-quinone oxidoreductase subunit C [uncultured Paludibaculum sp.]|uniref:hydrogenase large subunit n=1 Tax=uncultured Paludibaculum sp. TaxID=1765020 RepID=UPI002AAC45F6|nr:NADH-quinone oxidoreductase subunit C [uncultured Paludibaculum sp.]
MLPFLEDLVYRLGDQVDGVLARHENEIYLQLRDADSRPAISILREEHHGRVAAVFAEDRCAAEGYFFVYHVIEFPGSPKYLLLSTTIDRSDPRFPSHSVEVPALNWQEREIQDMFGIRLDDHPNPRRVALHDNWPDIHPLRKDFSLTTVLPEFEGERHVYRPALGEGVFQIPVGPVHAGIIEPGHFSFAVAGEPILYLQLRMFYTHKGTEKLFEGMPVEKAVFLAESISGDSSFSHGTAFCQAVERAGAVEIPPLAARMRTILLELERVYNHVSDIGAIATDVGFGIANAHASRLREILFGLNEVLTGNRLLRGMVRIGGVRRKWDESQRLRLMQTVREFESEFHRLIELILSSDSTRDRLERTGSLSPEKARDLGIVGVAGRASGIDLDVRRDHPYAAYGDLEIQPPLYEVGDVWHRMQVRIDEVPASLNMILEMAELALQGDPYTPSVQVPPGRCALSAVEGWRGEIMHWIRVGENNRLERCKIKDPSLNNWPALVEAVQGNIIPDFPVINKSFNLSYSGTDR